MATAFFRFHRFLTDTGELFDHQLLFDELVAGIDELLQGAFDEPVNFALQNIEITHALCERFCGEAGNLHRKPFCLIDDHGSICTGGELDLDLIRQLPEVHGTFHGVGIFNGQLVAGAPRRTRREELVDGISVFLEVGSHLFERGLFGRRRLRNSRFSALAEQGSDLCLEQSKDAFGNKVSTEVTAADASTDGKNQISRVSGAYEGADEGDVRGTTAAVEEQQVQAVGVQVAELCELAGFVEQPLEEEEEGGG